MILFFYFINIMMYMYLILIIIITYYIILSLKNNESFKNGNKELQKKKVILNKKEQPQKGKEVILNKKEEPQNKKKDIKRNHNQIKKKFNKINVKKTNKYKLIYNDRNFYIWEPQPIDDYFPLGQIITNKNKTPDAISILKKYDSSNSPDDYILVNMLNNNFAVWKPVSKNKTIKYLSNIINKNKPSLNRFQGIYTKFLEKSNTQELLKGLNIQNENEKRNKIKFWSIQNSPYFTIDNNDKCYYLPEYNILPEKKIVIKNTKKYVKIWHNKNNNKSITIWRPIPEKNYKIMGDIVLSDSYDPNDTLETPTIHKNSGKSVLYFKQPPLCYKTKNANICFWLPKQRDGYTTLGSVITLNNKEPPNDILYSIPITYVEYNKELLNVWNKENINIWSNDNILYTTKHFNKPFNTFILNPKYIHYDKDINDTKEKITLKFIPKNINSDNLHNNIINTISKKLDVDKSRIYISNIDKINNKIYMIIKEKKSNSIEDLTKDIVNELVDIVYKRNIMVKDKKKLILIINNIQIEQKKEMISLDNRLFKQNLKIK